MTVRIGIVGSQSAAALYAQAVQQTPGAELTAAASPNPDHVWEFHCRFGVPHVFGDYHDMIASGLVDAITIACPNDLHCQVAVDAAQAGKHVLVSRPLGLNLEQCGRMIEECRNAGVILMYGENLCFAPKYARAKELADQGALGEVYHLRLTHGYPGPQPDWLFDVNRSGGGALMDMGSQAIAYCRWVFGGAPVESVYAEAGTFVHVDRTRADDHAILALRFAPDERHPAGGLAVAEVSWARAGGPDQRVEICGSKGLTAADIGRGDALSTYTAHGYSPASERARTRGWSWTAYDDCWRHGFPQTMAHFVQCIEKGKPPTLTGEDGRAVIETIAAAYESARTGTRVALPFATDAARPIDLWLGD